MDKEEDKIMFSFELCTEELDCLMSCLESYKGSGRVGAWSLWERMSAIKNAQLLAWKEGEIHR